MSVYIYINHKQHSTTKAVTFPKINELPRVGLKPTCTCGFNPHLIIDLLFVHESIVL